MFLRRFVGNIDGNETLDKLGGNYYQAYYRIANALDIHFPVTGKKRSKFPEDRNFEDFNLVNTSIMHNKFALFADEQNKYTVTGSTNFTDTGFNLNNNNSVIIADYDLFNTYREQFEYLLGLSGRSPVKEIRKFIIENVEIEALFPPATISGYTGIEHMIQRIDAAESSIYFMIFSLTHLDLINKFITKFNNTVTVKGILDESQMYSSSEELLSNNGIPCRSDGNYNEIEYHGGKLHHKTMILDDKSVITGSFNWSYNANSNNDENIIIIRSKDIADLYKNEWQKRWNEGKEIVHTISNNNNPYDFGNYQDIIINEVMWMGSRQSIDSTLSGDEFIELKNMAGREIILTGWYLEGAARNGNRLYLENISIDADSMIVIMRRSIEDSAFIPDTCFESSSLSVSNSTLDIILKDPDNTIIDRAGNGTAAENFSGYSGITKKSMARNNKPGDGTDPVNWFITNTQINISSEYSYSLFNLATPGADNTLGDSGYDSLEIVISEISWAGTDVSHYDEWIEIYNNSDEDINLAGWSIPGSLNIELYGLIPAKKHFLLERTNDDSVPDKTADLIYSGSLSNTGAVIRLVYNNRDIDYINALYGWPAGSNDPKISMERINTSLPGEDTNWQNGLGDTEGAQNSSD
ncbi:MAG: lamin tail domain-containing protein [Spirochaetes bacterium]|nr:lamin tail domain-containing protein [Spirochaetota bacterium]